MPNYDFLLGCGFMVAVHIFFGIFRAIRKEAPKPDIQERAAWQAYGVNELGQIESWRVVEGSDGVPESVSIDMSC